MPQLPSGTVTFLFSDIESSTALLKALGDEGYAALLRDHRLLVRRIFAEHGGQEIDTQGDAFFYSFGRARAAVAAAVAVQLAHAQHSWPNGVSVRLRLGLHTGEPAVGEEGYTGLDVVRASRIAAVGRGGQVLLSESTRAIVAGDLPEGVRLRPLGSHRLKDIDQPEQLSELVMDELAEPDTAQPSADLPAPLGAPATLAPTAMPPRGFEPSGAISGLIRGATERFLPASNRLIEQRVLAEIERAFDEHPSGRGPRARGERDDQQRHRQPTPPPRPQASLADEIAKLQGLRERGALTDEQYERAVERALDRDRTVAD